jgi:hypothetical protein
MRLFKKSKIPFWVIFLPILATFYALGYPKSETKNFCTHFWVLQVCQHDVDGEGREIGREGRKEEYFNFLAASSMNHGSMEVH